MTREDTAEAQRTAIIQCQRDLGYGAAEIRVSTGYASDAKGASYDLRVLPGEYITAAAAAEINHCAESRLTSLYRQPVPVLQKRVHVAPVGYGCVPDAPVLYRGTLYCPKR